MEILQRVPLSDKTTFQIGGEAEFFCEPSTINEVRYVLSLARQNTWRVIVLGGGSNILFADGLIQGLVISTRALSWLREEELLWVGAGMTMDHLTTWAIENGKSGLEWSGGLPGTVGGATYMNARAYQHEMSEVVEKVRVIDFSGKEFFLSHKEIQYSYKKSIFMEHEDWIILEVGLKLHDAPIDDVRTKTEACRRDREQKGQYAYPSAGCAFKNDYSHNLPAGKVIDEIGLKGFSIGGAKVYEKHANFIINTGSARADDVIRLLEEIERLVYEKTGVHLEREVRIIR
ncbi:UDP-N-acetylmuramate dehydrogenase [Thermospira aquatica]|uniref:UDP-N-acetylenolpyruvoylglucosamine reductase n=1 Tax=Thermospira aquatica TaxID=2828656 RepID=A0AAX3BCS6_9SPIR|nr:UDP-N-acetylmuramate dehydrogenase [Thermospira aquatica]URA10024.1 UDP-N-acetylmuramate dehydrogenase [Thermospira aquatica]